MMSAAARRRCAARARCRATSSAPRSPPTRAAAIATSRAAPEPARSAARSAGVLAPLAQRRNEIAITASRNRGPRGSARRTACRSRLVAAITRTSTASSGCRPPAGPRAARARAGASAAGRARARRSRRGRRSRPGPRSKTPVRRVGRAGERALLVAEQLALDRVAGTRRNRSPRTALRARAAEAWMARATQLLAGAGLALDQDRASVGATRAKCREQLAHRDRLAEQALESSVARRAPCERARR